MHSNYEMMKRLGSERDRHRLDEAAAHRLGTQQDHGSVKQRFLAWLLRWQPRRHQHSLKPGRLAENERLV